MSDQYMLIWMISMLLLIYGGLSIAVWKMKRFKWIPIVLLTMAVTNFTNVIMHLYVLFAIIACEFFKYCPGFL